jgi:hypothetical protein
VTCDEKGAHCQPDLHLRYAVFPETQRVVEAIVNSSIAPRTTQPLKHCVVVDENNWRCQDVVTFKGANDGEWIGQDGFVGKDVPRYVWRVAVLRNWWDNLWN